ncbi:hypothetical protein CCR97_30660 [Rhodoplanes elegans]|uniref:Uncharacterized protein n=1 Tax=Rhodoplanes elegans TaxID=29408 RepID=A0A327KRR6_9BRAD|nr:hypothetical protein [Rhodoplanes elegans]MBK5962520.1 hypothetical protein [Rhodoplanes elegans]RAI41111.1 hypothetical protein CH338_04185 [Rhodoplanes elegans]
MSFPKKGKYFPGKDGTPSGREPPDGMNYAAEIAAALHRALDSTRAGAKTAAGWTGADERTAKNWFSGRYGPCGKHLVALARNSDEVLNAFLALAGRPDLVASAKLATAEQAISELLSAVRSLNGKAK